MNILKKCLCFMLSFSFILSEVQGFSTVPATDINYSVITIDTVDNNGNNIEKADGYVEISGITICDEDGNISIQRENQQDYIKVRGNTTSLGEKKPFDIKFKNRESVLGMPESKKWCLLANCYDPTLLRNYVAFGIGGDMGLAVPECRIVALILDGVYKGCYLLTENIKNVANIDTEKGEFLIQYELERAEGREEYFTSGELRFLAEDPDYTDLENPEFTYNGESYKSYIQATLDKLIAILDQGDYQKVKDNFDVDSLAKLYVFSEYYKNADVGYSSVKYIYRDGKLTAGPLWDYDLSSGNAREEGYFDENYRSYNTIWANVQLFAKLLEYPEFKTSVIKYYHSYMDIFAKYYKNNGVIDKTVLKYGDMIESNFSPDGAGWEVSKIYSAFMRTPDETYNENLNFFKKWLKRRNQYLFLHYLCCGLSDKKVDSATTSLA